MRKRPVDPLFVRPDYGWIHFLMVDQIDRNVRALLNRAEDCRYFHEINAPGPPGRKARWLELAIQAESDAIGYASQMPSHAEVKASVNYAYGGIDPDEAEPVPTPLPLAAE